MIITAEINSYQIGNKTPVTILRAGGFDSPRVQNNLFPISGRHGSKLPTTYWRERRVTLELGIRKSSASEFATVREDLFEAFNLPTKGLSTLKFSTVDGKDLQLDVQLMNKIEAPFEPGRITSGIAFLELVAPDPYMLGQSLTETEIALPVAGGTGIPTEIPLSLVSSGGVETITITGNGINKPTITIKGPVTNPTILNATTGESFSISGSYLSTDTIIIDTDAETVIQNGIINLLDVFSGDFIDLRPGMNQINFSSSVYDADALATIAWRNSYLSI